MAERALATAYVNIVPGTQAVEQYLKGGLPAVAGGAGTSAGTKFSSGFGSKIKGMVGALGVTFGAIGLVNFTKDLITAGQEEVKGNKRLDQIAKSMGIFGDKSGDVSARLQDLSGKMQMQLGIDDDVIKSTQAKLLTFKELAKTADEQGGAFDRATQAAVDLAAAGFGSAENNAIQLGKALQDPIKGISSLARSGVTFTKSEKDRIKTLVESNKIGEAQNLVLKAIETQVGGTAKATATSGDKMAQGYAQVQESLGLLLLPALDDLATFLNTSVFPAVTNFVEAFKKGETPLNTIISALTAVYNWVVQNATWLGPLAAAVMGAVLAYKIWTGAILLYNNIMRIAAAVQLAWNTALATNPIMIVVVAVAALVAGLVWFFTQTKLGQQIWKNFTGFLTKSMSAVVGFFGSAWNGIKDAFMTVFKFIASAFRGYVNIWLGFINTIINGLNTIHVDIPDWVPLVGGQKWGINIPNIPMLANGGFVTGPTQAIIGEAGPEVVTPLKDFERMMGITDAKSQPIYADGIGLIGWMRQTAQGQAQIVFDQNIGKSLRGAR